METAIENAEHLIESVEIMFPASSLEDLCQALAEGEHGLGAEITAAGYDVIAWPNTGWLWILDNGYISLNEPLIEEV